MTGEQSPQPRREKMSNDKTPEPGDIVYNEDGYECEYVAPAGDHGHVVMYLQEDEDQYGIHRPMSPHIERTVYSTRPRPRRAGYLKKLEADISKAREELTTIRREHREEAEAFEAKSSRLKNLAPALERIEDFIDGRITHVVERAYASGDPEIRTLDETLKGNGYHSGPKLVSLFGDSDGLLWRVNRYRNGSGSWTDIIPCRSPEEALDVARGMCTRVFATCLAENRAHALASTIAKATEYGFEIPSEAIAANEAYQQQRATEARAKAAMALAKADAVIEALSSAGGAS